MSLSIISLEWENTHTYTTHKVPISADVGRLRLTVLQSQKRLTNPRKILQEFKSQMKRMGEIPTSFRFEGEGESLNGNVKLWKALAKSKPELCLLLNPISTSIEL